MKNSLEIKNLSIGYPRNKPLLENLNFSVGKGSIVALMGRNGMGKTSLIRTIACLMKPLAGEIDLYGEDLLKMPESLRSKKISVVLTERTFIGNIKAEELIRFGRYPFTGRLGIERSEDKSNIQEAIDLCGVEAFLPKRLSELSDGERQKVMLTRCIAQTSEIILMDEPSAHLDIANRAQVFNLMSNLSKKRGVTFIFSSHEVNSALKIATDVWLIGNNEFQYGPVSKFNDGKLLSKAFGVDVTELGL